MRGYCAKCQEFRSENGIDAWRILWNDSTPLCEKCGSLIDVWRNHESNHNIINRMLGSKETHSNSGQNGE